MTTEAKVGAFTFAGLALLAVLVAMLSGLRIGGEKSYTLHAGFVQVIGVEKQSTVRLSGVPVGTVTGVGNEGGGVVVDLSMQADVKVPRGSRVVIGSSGVMGEKFINILPAEDRGDYLRDGEYLVGEEEAGVDTMFAGISKTLRQVQELLTSMNGIMGNQDLQRSVVEMTKNMNETSIHVSRLVESLERMAIGSETNVKQMMANLNQATGSMQRTMVNVEQMMANLNRVGGDPQTVENLRMTLQNITDTSERVARIAENLEKFAGDPQTADDLKATVHNARVLSEKAGNLLGGGNLKAEPSVDVLYRGGARDWSINGALEVGAEKGVYGVLGASNIGDGTKFEGQLGTRSEKYGARAGVMDGKAGVGVDAYADKFKFSLDAYNPDDVELRVKAFYEIGDGTYFMGQVKDAADSERRKTYFGIHQTF